MLWVSQNMAAIPDNAWVDRDNRRGNTDGHGVKLTNFNEVSDFCTMSQTWWT